jgi:hypothetical protein
VEANPLSFVIKIGSSCILLRGSLVAVKEETLYFYVCCYC